MNFVTQVEVIKIIVHNNDIREYECKLDQERKYNPGSFVQLTLDLVTASDIWPDSRTFSIASFEGGIMRFIIKKTGKYT
jgi:predicted ferric reductase